MINPITTATQGLAKAADSFNKAATDVSKRAPAGLETDAVQITQSSIDYKANAKVIQVASTLQKRLLNFKT